MAAAAGMTLGCLGCLGCLSSQGETNTSNVVLTASETAQGDDTTMGSSSQPGIMTTTEAPESSVGPESSSSNSSSSGEGTTMAIPAGCGDGVVDADEACDEGEANANEGSCTQSCKLAACGDGFVQAGVGEACDDGVNDGTYGGCAQDCLSLAPRCGDGAVDAEFETCDGGTPWAVGEGCLPNCGYAKSCLQLLEAFRDEVALVNGVYTIQAKDTLALPVYCEMEADGGGYTYLKVAVPKDKAKASAKDAEAKCAEYGMQLLVPRTQAHLTASVAAAKSALLMPVGGGAALGDIEYMSILGVYPVTAGKSCVGKAFNSAACPEWKASDKGEFWVSDEPVAGEPSVKNCAECSMSYYWTAGGMLEVYQAVLGGGGQSWLFMCDVGDK